MTKVNKLSAKLLTYGIQIDKTQWTAIKKIKNKYKTRSNIQQQQQQIYGVFVFITYVMPCKIFY